MPDSIYRFTKTVAQLIRQIIADSGKNEVFFLGRTNLEGLIIEVEPLAKGNSVSVPAIIAPFSSGDIAIHNHPSGDLTPSDQDIEIAAVLGNMGAGFSIINNDVTRCYEVVPPFKITDDERISPAEITSFLSPSGRLSQIFKGFEYREEQISMALTVAESFNENKVAVIEAGTGTGKSLAYLYPAILWGVRNRERIAISTNTINLQEQLIRKDIPLLKTAVETPFRSVLVKGRSNYICKRKLHFVSDNQSLFKDQKSSELDSIVEWIQKTRDGSKSDLPFVPLHELWEEISCEADQCSKIRCPFYNDCFYFSARKSAASADIIVLNHSLLMNDLAIKHESDQNNGVIPAFSYLIIDEAHHLEEAATGNLGFHLSYHLISKNIERLYSKKRSGSALLDQLMTLIGKKLEDGSDTLYRRFAELVEDELIPLCQNSDAATLTGMDSIMPALNLYNERRNKERCLRITGEILTSKLWEITKEAINVICKELRQLCLKLEDISRLVSDLPQSVKSAIDGTLTDIDGIKYRLTAIADESAAIAGEQDNFCRWFEIRKTRHGDYLQISSAPVKVDSILDSILFSKMKSVILTSATLSVSGGFDYLKNRTGLHLISKTREVESILPSPFDYTKQIKVYLPDDIPEPSAPFYMESLAESVLLAVTASQGRAFILFTSYQHLNFVHKYLSVHLNGYNLFKQGEMERHSLLVSFRKAEKAVLLGTDSFWEGVDVKGEALEQVIIARLPFKVPSEPIQEARAENIEAQGGDPFREMTIPQAVIKFKQGVGRLIRSRWDRGVILVLDSRICTKSYGKSFLKALPSGETKKGKMSMLAEDMKDFFRKAP